MYIYTYTYIYNIYIYIYIYIHIPLCGNKRIFQFLYLICFLLFGSNHDCDHDFDHFLFT